MYCVKYTKICVVIGMASKNALNVDWTDHPDFKTASELRRTTRCCNSVNTQEQVVHDTTCELKRRMAFIMDHLAMMEESFEDFMGKKGIRVTQWSKVTMIGQAIVRIGFSEWKDEFFQMNAVDFTDLVFDRMSADFYRNFE